MSQSDVVIISDPGGAHATRVSVIAAQASWSLSNIGAFSAFARVDDLRSAGWGRNIKGCWVEWAAPAAGRWGGVITGRPITDGIAEILAEDWAGLLRGRVLDVWDRPQWGTPAGLARMAVSHAVHDRPSFITVGERQEAGAPPVSITLGGQDLLSDVLPALTDLGLEWRVDADRVLLLGRRLGRDLSTSVTFTDDREILSYQFADDALAITQAQTIEVESAQEALLREQIHLREGRGWRDPRIISSRGRPVGVPLVASVSGQTPLTTPFSAQVRNIGHAWGRCEVGDTIRVVLGGLGFYGLFRIVERSLDIVGRVMTLSGEVTSDPPSVVFA